MVFTAESRKEGLFFNETAFLFLKLMVSRTVKTRKFNLLYETCYWNGNLYKDLLFDYLQLSGNENL